MQLMYETCAGLLLTYPDLPGASGERVRARRRGGPAHRLGGWAHVHVHDQPRVPVLAAVQRPCDSGYLCAHDRSGRKPGRRLLDGDLSASGGCERRPAFTARQGPAARWSRRPRRQADGQADCTAHGSPGPPRNDQLLRGARRHAVRTPHRADPLRRPPYLFVVSSGPARLDPEAQYGTLAGTGLGFPGRSSSRLARATQTPSTTAAWLTVVSNYVSRASSSRSTPTCPTRSPRRFSGATGSTAPRRQQASARCILNPTVTLNLLSLRRRPSLVRLDATSPGGQLRDPPPGLGRGQQGRTTAASR